MKKQGKNSVTLQQNIVFSRCDLWKLQRTFFEQQGIKAWSNQVPFYITSNPYIAYTYANIIIRFIQDTIRQNRYKPLEPFYILELGCGHGMLGFHILKQLLELRSQLQLDDVVIIYIMSDFTANNIEYLAQHPALQPYLKQGILDLAHYDIENTQYIQLLRSRTLLNSRNLGNPLIVLANYVFDTVPHDVFRVKNGEIEEGLVTLTTHAANLSQEKPVQLEAIKLNFTYLPIAEDYYHNHELDTVLNYYRRYHQTMTFIYPIGSLRCLQNLQKISGNNMLLIATDKGYSDHLHEYGKSDPEIAYHGSFSMMVNFHAIGLYIRQCGGDYYHQARQQAIVSSAFVLGQKFETLPETKQALNTYFNHFSPGNLFNNCRLTQWAINTWDLMTLVTQLEMSYWDPQIFDQSLAQILKLLPNSDPIILNELLSKLPTLAENYYYMPNSINTLYNIGNLLQHLGRYQEALQYYQQALTYNMQDYNIYCNMGICYCALHNYSVAVEVLNKAVILDPSNVLGLGWLTKARNQLKPNGHILSIG